MQASKYLEPEEINAGEVYDISIKMEYPDIEYPNDDAIAIEDARLIRERQLMFENPTYNLWTSKATACLIKNYKKYRSLVGQTNKFRSLRDMFDKISLEMQKDGFYFNTQKCENKWRVLERKYKNLVAREAMNKPGRMKHYGYWEHRKAMDEIYTDLRKSLQPECDTLKSNTTLVQEKSNESLNLTNNRFEESSEENSNDGVIEKEKLSVAANFDRIYQFLNEIKNHFEVAEQNRKRRHSEKIALLKFQHNEKMELMKTKIKLKKKMLFLKKQKYELKKLNIVKP